MKNNIFYAVRFRSNHNEFSEIFETVSRRAFRTIKQAEEYIPIFNKSVLNRYKSIGTLDPNSIENKILDFLVEED